MEYEGAGMKLRGSARTVTEGPSSSSQAGLNEVGIFIPTTYPFQCRLLEMIYATAGSLILNVAETMWTMNLRGSDSMETGPYPERPGEPDCTYYIRTGICRFGRTCKFNHPPNRIQAVAAARISGGFPVRVGQPECQYYLKTGTCKFGATCKFHHPKDKAGNAGRIQLNILGYPLRPNEKECSYYTRTGECKFGSTCKFHHPHPSNPVAPIRGSPVHPSVHSPTSPSQQSYPGGMTTWTLSSSLIPSPRWQTSSSFPQLFVPQGMVQVPGWASYSGQLGSSIENQQNIGTAQICSPLLQGETSVGDQGKFPSYRPGSVSMGLYAVPRENIFPERPGQPECQFYMKTGDCKFGAVCRFHHPRDRIIPTPNCALNPMGLPLRPGEPVCVFYSRYGICKFGPNCKFDHPIGTMTYGFPLSPTADVRHLLGPSSEPPTLILPSGQNANSGAGVSRLVPQPESRQTASGDENDEES